MLACIFIGLDLLSIFWDLRSSVLSLTCKYFGDSCLLRVFIPVFDMSKLWIIEEELAFFSSKHKNYQIIKNSTLWIHIKIVFLNFIFFRNILCRLLSQVWIVTTWQSFPSSLLWIYFNRSIETSFFSQVSKFIIEPTHIVCRFSFSFPLLVAFNDCLMLAKFFPTGTSPGTTETIALLTFLFGTLPSNRVMLLERMFAEALKIISPVRWYVIETFAFALWCLARGLFGIVVKVVVVFEFMITEAFCLRTNHLTLLVLSVSPT